MASEILTINEYGLTRRSRTLKSGATKSRYTISVTSEPVLINVDERALTRQVADAAEKIYRDRIMAISAEASPATIRAREAARRGLQRNEPWVAKRYSGGKTGTTVPGKTNLLFRDSDRLLNSIKIGATKSGWVLNVAANRLDPSTLNGGEAALLRIMERLREFVPEWGDPQALNRHLDFRRALQQSLKDALAKANERTVQLKMQLMQQTVGKLLRLVA